MLTKVPVRAETTIIANLEYLTYPVNEDSTIHFVFSEPVETELPKGSRVIGKEDIKNIKLRRRIIKRITINISDPDINADRKKKCRKKRKRKRSKTKR
ncbi:MAG: hypothetical protein GY810_11860 [Aureispira sp.]|nr:hypothetical protein [Aureispira sp.]